MYLRFGKRVFDTMVALAGLVIISPVLLACVVAIYVDSQGPVFFRQRRVGRYGRTFRIFKFRTMTHGADKKGIRLTAAGDVRVTQVGRFLRKTKLDEAPQLLNVVRGEMSLVGPRPEVPEYTRQYTPEEWKVLAVRPGITGPASLAYIDEERLLASAADPETFYVATLMRRKLRFDLAYCRNISFLEDLRIVFRTIAGVAGWRPAATEEPCVSNE